MTRPTPATCTSTRRRSTTVSRSSSRPTSPTASSRSRSSRRPARHVDLDRHRREQRQGNAYLNGYTVNGTQDVYARITSGGPEGDHRDARRSRRSRPTSSRRPAPTRATSTATRRSSPTAQKVPLTANFPTASSRSPSTRSGPRRVDARSAPREQQLRQRLPSPTTRSNGDAERVRAQDATASAPRSHTLTPTVIVPDNFPDTGDLSRRRPRSTTVVTRTVKANFPSGTFGVTLYKETAPGVWTAVGQKTSNSSGDASFTGYAGQRHADALRAHEHRQAHRGRHRRAEGAQRRHGWTGEPRQQRALRDDRLRQHAEHEGRRLRGQGRARVRLDAFRHVRPRDHRRARQLHGRQGEEAVQAQVRRQAEAVRHEERQDLDPARQLRRLDAHPQQGRLGHRQAARRPQVDAGQQTFAELFLNGKYLGSYQMVESIKIDKQPGQRQPRPARSSSSTRTGRKTASPASSASPA